MRCTPPTMFSCATIALVRITTCRHAIHACSLLSAGMALGPNLGPIRTGQSRSIPTHRTTINRRLVMLGYPSALTWISQVRSCFIVADLPPPHHSYGFRESESSPGAYHFLWQLGGDATIIAISLALESCLYAIANQTKVPIFASA